MYEKRERERDLLKIQMYKVYELVELKRCNLAHK